MSENTLKRSAGAYINCIVSWGYAIAAGYQHSTWMDSDQKRAELNVLSWHGIRAMSTQKCQPKAD